MKGNKIFSFLTLIVSLTIIFASTFMLVKFELLNIYIVIWVVYLLAVITLVLFISLLTEKSVNTMIFIVGHIILLVLLGLELIFHTIFDGSYILYMFSIILIINPFIVAIKKTN